ncbi:MAG: hypothetical protein RLY15_1574 [Bacteroidota bacterium]|jgi:hypothetical protein
MSNESKGWYVQLDTGTYKQGEKPPVVRASLDGGELVISDVKSLKSAVSASISLPLYGNEMGEEAIGKSYAVRKSAMDLITALKSEAKYEGDLDVRVDTWKDDKGNVKSALKYVVYSKKRELK